VFTFGTANSSFIEFVADTDLKEVTATQIDTFTFYKNIDEIAKSDKQFAAYYNAAVEHKTTLVFALLALFLPVAFQKML